MRNTEIYIKDILEGQLTRSTLGSVVSFVVFQSHMLLHCKKKKTVKFTVKIKTAAVVAKILP